MIIGLGLGFFIYFSARLLVCAHTKAITQPIIVQPKNKFKTAMAE